MNWKLNAATALLIALPMAASAQQAAWPSVTPAPGKIVAISHRGEHLHHPENTIAAFQAAIVAGADFFEIDVQTTSDGKLVLMHDGSVNRMTTSTGRVSDFTFDQIRALDVGKKFSPEFANTKIPTLDEAFDLAYGKINVYVDTKNADAKLLVDTIVRHGMENHVVIYGNPFFLHDVQKLRPDLRIMPEAYSVDVCKLLTKAMPLKVLAFSASDFKEEVIQVAKQANAMVYVDRMGATDGPQGWQTAIDLGANGIQTDRPAELVEYLRAHQIANH
ncbi:MAG: glycerophosphoryl diester phosphodiesterase [Acidobacteriaceae bacterium]|nr:glycerophosphoryl diester phosphodiesterase [Acidobacteriaceae bacterium]